MKSDLHLYRKCNKDNPKDWKPVPIKAGRSFTCPKLIYIQEQSIINILLLQQKQFDRSGMSYLMLNAIVDTENEMSIINSKLAELKK